MLCATTAPCSRPHLLQQLTGLATREANKRAKLSAAWLRFWSGPPATLHLSSSSCLFHISSISLLAAATQQRHKAVLHTTPPICTVQGCHLSDLQPRPAIRSLPHPGPHAPGAASCVSCGAHPPHRSRTPRPHPPPLQANREALSQPGSNVARSWAGHLTPHFQDIPCRPNGRNRSASLAVIYARLHRFDAQGPQAPYVDPPLQSARGQTVRPAWQSSAHTNTGTGSEDS